MAATVSGLGLRAAGLMVCLDRSGPGRCWWRRRHTRRLSSCTPLRGGPAGLPAGRSGRAGGWWGQGGACAPCDAQRRDRSLPLSGTRAHTHIYVRFRPALMCNRRGAALACKRERSFRLIQQHSGTWEGGTHAGAAAGRSTEPVRREPGTQSNKCHCSSCYGGVVCSRRRWTPSLNPRPRAYSIIYSCLHLFMYAPAAST